MASVVRMRMPSLLWASVDTISSRSHRVDIKPGFFLLLIGPLWSLLELLLSLRGHTWHLMHDEGVQGDTCCIRNSLRGHCRRKSKKDAVRPCADHEYPALTLLLFGPEQPRSEGHIVCSPPVRLPPCFLPHVHHIWYMEGYCDTVAQWLDAHPW